MNVTEINAQIEDSIFKTETRHELEFTRINYNRERELYFLMLLKPYIPLIEKSLAKQHLVIDTLTYHKVGSGGDWQEDSDMKISINAKSDGSFKFIKDTGYTSKGNSRNQATLHSKGQRLEEALTKGIGLDIRVNDFSLEYDPYKWKLPSEPENQYASRKSLLEKTIIIETWLSDRLAKKPLEV